MVKCAVYPTHRKQEFGEYLTRFYRDVSLWPKALVDYYDAKFRDMTPRQQSRGLTAELLLEWMAHQTGMTQLVDPEYKKYYVTLLGSWGRWRNSPNIGGDSAPLMSVIAACGIVVNGDDKPITEPVELMNYLFGSDSPTDQQSIPE